MRRTVIATALLSTLACSGFSDPSEDIEGRYVLRTVAGEPVPTVAFSGELATVTLIADTIVLRHDGTGTESSVTTAVSSVSIRNPAHDPLRPVVSQFRWERQGDALAIEFGCPDNASCVAPPHRTGRFTATGLELGYALSWRTPLVYERVE
jgi:hypothetical protein